MARNIKRYGYAPNRNNDTPYAIQFASVQHRAQRYRERKERRTPQARELAQMPMQYGARILAYWRQSVPARLRTADMPRQFTPRQQRRLRHKSKLGAVAYARGARP